MKINKQKRREDRMPAEGIVEKAAMFSGKAQLLRWFDVFFVDDDGHPVPNVEFEVIYANGKKETCRADKDGYFKDDKAPEGLIKIRLKDGSIIEPYGDSDDFSKDDADPENDKAAKIEYVIRKGDTLSKIAGRFGTTWRELYRTSGPDGVKNSKRLKSGNPNLIYPGEIIWVPTKRRVVRIHTDNAAKAVAKIRVRKKKRTDTHKKIARRWDIYHERIKQQAHDNLLIVAGWDEDKKNLHVEKLCETLNPIVKFVYPKVGKKWNLYLIRGRVMSYYDSEGKFQHSFVLSTTPLGLAGAYSIFERKGTVVTAAIYDRSYGIGAHGYKPGGFEMTDLIDDSKEKKKYLESFIEVRPEGLFFKKLPILFMSPTSKGGWQSIVLNGGNGLLDDYVGENGYNDKAHDRNLAVLDTYNSHYRGLLKGYIEKVKAVPPEKGEDALRALGPPPEPYRFPMPLGGSPSQRRELATKIVECSSYSAWLAISEKIFDIQNERWPSMSARHREGSLFFRVKFTLEPSAAEAINSLKDSYLFGHLSSYKTVKLEWNFDVGTDGIKTGKSRSVTFKENSVLKLRKFSIGAGREVEIDESGGKKVTVKGNFLDYGFEAASDGEHKLTGPGVGLIGTSASGNLKTAEGGQGINVGIPGVGSVYIGIHFVGIKADTLLVYLTGAPGFFERKSPDTLVKTMWTNLTYTEIKKLEILGWDQETWDIKDQMKYNKLPKSARTSFDVLSYDRRIAAMHLGFQDRWAEKWIDFWKILPPVKGYLPFKPMVIRALDARGRKDTKRP